MKTQLDRINEYIDSLDREGLLKENFYTFEGSLGESVDGVNTECINVSSVCGLSSNSQCSNQHSSCSNGSNYRCMNIGGPLNEKVDCN